jgi:integrase
MGTMSVTPEVYVTAAGEERWKVRFRLNARATSRTFTDPRGAAQFASLLSKLGPARAVAVLDQRTAAPSGTLTLEDYARRHVSGLTGVGEGHRARSRAMIDNDLTDLGPLPIDAVTDVDVRAWVNAMETKGASGKTIKNKHGFLASVCRHALADRLITTNPCEGTRLPRTVDEYAAFLGYFTPKWQPLVAFLFGSGARFSEATALTAGDVDLSAGLVRITKAWKDNGHRVGPPKSAMSARSLSLAPETIEVLRPLVEHRPADRLIFVNANGGRVSGQTFHDNAWQPAVRLANGEAAQGGKRIGRRRDSGGNPIQPAAPGHILGKRPRVHDARHSCASWLLAAGAPLNVVQAHMGHESIVTTTRTYGHLLPSARSAVSTALSLALTGGHPRIGS